MSWSCKLFGHYWGKREINPHKEMDYGYWKVCERCGEFGEKVRPDGWEDE